MTQREEKMSFESYMKEPAERVILAIINKGSHPEYHDEIAKMVEEKWPTLWNALDHFRVNYESWNINKTDSSSNPGS